MNKTIKYNIHDLTDPNEETLDESTAELETSTDQSGTDYSGE